MKVATEARLIHYRSYQLQFHSRSGADPTSQLCHWSATVWPVSTNSVQHFFTFM